MNNEATIISVESRKGGVGKTSVALNIAKNLHKRGKIVLLIDLDFTGTNICDAIEGSIIEPKINIVKKQDKRVNLVKLFYEDYLSGKGVDKWTTTKNSGLLLSKSDINILGSDMFYSNNTNTQINPELLFDDLHSYWLIEFLQLLINGFVNQVKGLYEIYIVLDNSPGFTGIGPAVEEWLTDIGPQKGKFLFVSSLDKQDLIACQDSMLSIHHKFKCKSNAAVAYMEVNDNIFIDENDLKLNNIEEDFYLKLCNQEFINGANSFYAKISQKECDKYKNTPEKYLFFLINKIPKIIMDGTFKYDFSNIKAQLNEQSQEYQLSPLFFDFPNLLKKFSVGLDENMSYQFYNDIISKPSPSSKKTLHTNQMSSYIVNAQDMIWDTEISIVVDLYAFDPSRYKKTVLNEINRLQRLFDNIIQKMKIYGFEHVANSIDIKIYPETPFRELQQKVFEMFDYGLSLTKDIEWDLLPENQIELIYNKYFKSNISNYLDSNKPSPFHSFCAMVFLVIPFELTKSNQLDRTLKVYQELLKLQLSSYNDFVKKEKKSSVIKFLMNEKIDSISKILAQKINTMGILEDEFIEAYQYLCHAQARFLDLKMDLEFLLKALNWEVVENREIMSNLSNLLADAILNKTAEHKVALRQISIQGTKIEYDRNLSRVINPILKTWEI